MSHRIMNHKNRQSVFSCSYDSVLHDSVSFRTGPLSHRIMEHKIMQSSSSVLMILCLMILSPCAQAQPATFFETHCYSCHDATVKKGGLDLAALKVEPANADNFARWLKVHDRIESGEMPPRNKARPSAAESAAAV